MRRVTNLPVAIGFGISLPGHVAMLGGLADAAVVGSALVEEIEQGGHSWKPRPPRSAARVKLLKDAAGWPNEPAGAGPMSIEDWRRRIDEIDRKLVQLLNERSRCVVEIGRIKHTTGEPLYQPDREHRVLDGVVRANPGPLSDDAVRRLFERILDEARSVERVVMQDDEKKKVGVDSPRKRGGFGCRQGRGFDGHRDA